MEQPKYKQKYVNFLYKEQIVIEEKCLKKENHQYSLLLLRLQRAKIFQNRMGIKKINSGSSFNNKNEEEEEEIIQWTNKILQKKIKRRFK
ncbi:hypothetical protein Mgra_00010196 [Meloidogyne graminicola]|uniref:Uncharacterized protein n=1 Tax=Meloidogyne graminicola TaxID=189291 RepID=A0A8S9Z7F9_9BILA|nr:hypothetical protein Mgra_00010196 [Meloidogyne graminicola]